MRTPFPSPFSFHGEPQAVFRRKKEATVGKKGEFFRGLTLERRFLLKE